MKARYIILMFLLIMVVVPSCKKEDPKPAPTGQGSSSPVFSFSGEINGIPVTIQPGLNGYYLETSKQVDNNGIYEFVSELKERGCASNCSQSLKISVKNNTAGANINIDSAISPGYYAYAMPSGARSNFTQTFIGGLASNKTGTLFKWDFGDNTPIFQSASSSTSHIYTRSGIYKVGLTVYDSSGCSSTITNNIKVGEVGNVLSVQIVQSSIGGSSLSFVPIVTGGQAPYSYSWDFGDGGVSNTISPTHDYTGPGVYNLTLTVTDAAGNTDVQHINVSVANPNGCSAYFYSSSILYSADVLNRSGVVIEWKDASGNIWTSANDSQAGEKSMFKINTVEEYLKNEKGQSTKKISVDFSCKLYNGANSIEVKNAKATIAVAY